MATEYFPKVQQTIKYEGPDSRNPYAFKHYNADEKVAGKTMREHLRYTVCYWHTFKNLGADPFGMPTAVREYNKGANPMVIAEQTMQAAFEFFQKLGVDFWCFHDRDIAPEGESLAETNRNLDHIAALAKKLQEDAGGMRPLWGTACLFQHPRYMAGGGTNPNADIVAYAGAQVKKCMEVTQELGGRAFLFWGGREGYECLWNTDMGREIDNLGRFLHMAVDYKKKLGFDGPLYIEPKPKEPTKHQYDFDAQSCHAFLMKYGLKDTFRLNIEANHATLAGHTFFHELEYSIKNGLFGSVDANRGDLLLGWDTDQFPTDIYQTTRAMYAILRGGGFTTGGLNFDAKLRRQSIDPNDLFHAHIGAMDAFARGLKIAAKMLEDGVFEEMLAERYKGWDSGIGARIASGEATLEECEAHALKNGEPQPESGRQEFLEALFNEYIR